MSKHYPVIQCKECHCAVAIEDYEAVSKITRSLIHVCKCSCALCGKHYGVNQNDVDGEAFGNDEWMFNKERIALAIENISDGEFFINREVKYR